MLMLIFTTIVPLFLSTTSVLAVPMYTKNSMLNTKDLMFMYTKRDMMDKASYKRSYSQDLSQSYKRSADRVSEMEAEEQQGGRRMSKIF